MAASNFGEKFAALKDATQRQRGLELSSALRDAINALAALPEIDDVAVANTLLELSSPTGAGFLAVWLGARVSPGRSNPTRARYRVRSRYLARVGVTHPGAAKIHPVRLRG